MRSPTPFPTCSPRSAADLLKTVMLAVLACSSRSWRRSARLGLLMLIASAGAGCVLIVDHSPSGDSFSSTCAVADPSTTCGTCIDNACGAQLDACCADTTCRTVLSSVDSCSEAGSCIVDTTGTAASALESCIAVQCPSCQVLPATVYDAGIYCSDDLTMGWCQCSTESILGQATTRCDQTTIPGGICCADQTWPSSGTCTCGTISCSSQTDSCSCSFNLGITSISCNQSGGGFCCATAYDCTCGSTPCDSNATPVSDCDVPSSIACPSGQHVISNCSSE